ncbi:GNAT family N-acetyltransferase [Novosphingobium piscinae]|uniref:N-acetyltransferase n=1 Tax=Novosphingobium piscinae TaxID=1507448 RepID=A0A7X1G2D9_9SPHN|nr:GNAT family N-acetyltransferase [Novosphingobium piscinae]MBC2670742.1 N-acetyltransferase [Novosphingobium piscinae]
MALHIRAARDGDAAAIAAIYAAHVLTGTATFDTVPRSLADFAAKIVESAARGWPFLVAEAEGTVLGYAYAAPFRDRAAYAATCEDSIYVAAGRTGEGIGTGLLGALLVAAEAAGFRQMIAVIGGGEPASIALHARLGFAPAGRLRAVGRKFGRWLDTVYMQAPLGAGDSAPPPVEP